MEHMDTKLSFGDIAAFETPMLALFAADLATGKDDDPRPALVHAAGFAQAATQSLLGSGEFKAALGEVAVLHAPVGL